MDALAKRGNQQQCILENYDTCPAFVYAAFVWDMEHLGTTRMCPIKAIMLAVVWHHMYLNNTPLFIKKEKKKKKKRKEKKDKTFGTTIKLLDFYTKV